VLNDVEGISETAVFGVPHHDFGEMIVADCVPLGLAEFDEGALRAAVEGRLVGFKHPGVYCEMNALPRNNMGKVQKTSCAKALLWTRKACFYVSDTGWLVSKDCAAASAKRCAATPSSIDGFGAAPVANASIKDSISAT